MKRAWLITLPLLAMLPACQTAGPPLVAQGDVVVGQADSAEYLDRVASQPNVTEADAVTGMLLLLNSPKKMTFAQGVELLRQRKIISGQWSCRADREITRGKVAYMVYQVCNMTGGLTLQVFGPSERYCLRELQYRGLMAKGLSHTEVTGMEYVAILARADELRETGDVTEVMKNQEGAE